MSFRLDIDICLGRFLLDRDVLNTFQGILGEYCPHWAGGLHLWRHHERKIPILVNEPDALWKVIHKKNKKKGCSMIN